MKRLTLIALLLLTIISGSVEAKNDKKDMSRWLTEHPWKQRKRTGINTVDGLYDKTDKLVRSIQSMADSLPMYSLRSIVNNGDTVAIVVVDQHNNLYNSLSAANQYISGGLYLTNITANAADLLVQYLSLLKDLPSIVKSKGFGSVKIISDVTSASNYVRSLVKDFLPWVKESYNRRGNPIKAYAKAQAEMSPDDGFVNTGFDHVPEFSPDDMPTDAELDAALAQERSNRTRR